MNGSLCRLLLLTSLILIWAQGTEAAPVAAKVGESDVVGVLPDSKVLWAFIAVNAIQVVVWLAKSIWDDKTKQLREIRSAVDQIPALIHKIETMDRHLRENVPTRDQTELMIFRQMKDKTP